MIAIRGFGASIARLVMRGFFSGAIPVVRSEIITRGYGTGSVYNIATRGYRTSIILPRRVGDSNTIKLNVRPRNMVIT